MEPSYLTAEAISSFIQSALQEDIGEGDHSALGAVPDNHSSKAQLFIKEDGVIAGLQLAEKIFKQYDPRLSVTFQKHDGEKISVGDIAFFVEGPSQSILSTERLVLNCIQRMSGVATYTKKLCALVKDTPVQLLDTRKTTPNFRLLEKWAVFIGGGHNHRFGLYDRMILKDNHIDIAGGIELALTAAKKYLSDHKKNIEIEVETRNIEEVKDVMRIGGVNRIMFDNMSVSEMKEAVKIVDKKMETEASGGISESNLREVAMCGVDYISVGRLTYSTESLDMSLNVVK